jgi:hypothetical protein
LRSDPTVDRIVLENIPRDCSASSSLLSELLRRGRLCINESSVDFLHILFANLDNPELTESLIEFDFSRSELNSSNCISRFETKSRYRIDNSREKSFIAAHFFELERSSIERLRVSDLDSILSDESVRVESEDWLLSLLVSLGSDFLCLLG